MAQQGGGKQNPKGAGKGAQADAADGTVVDPQLLQQMVAQNAQLLQFILQNQGNPQQVPQGAQPGNPPAPQPSVSTCSSNLREAQLSSD